jgi:hypothetical protein
MCFLRLVLVRLGVLPRPPPSCPRWRNYRYSAFVALCGGGGEGGVAPYPPPHPPTPHPPPARPVHNAQRPRRAALPRLRARAVRPTFHAWRRRPHSRCTPAKAGLARGPAARPILPMWSDRGGPPSQATRRTPRRAAPRASSPSPSSIPTSAPPPAGGRPTPRRPSRPQPGPGPSRGTRQAERRRAWCQPPARQGRRPGARRQAPRHVL